MNIKIKEYAKILTPTLTITENTTTDVTNVTSVVTDVQVEKYQWDIIEKPKDYLCFTAEEPDCHITMAGLPGVTRKNKSNDIEFDIEYSFDKEIWIKFIPYETEVVLQNIGDKVYFRGDNTIFGYDHDADVLRFETWGGNMAVSGNIMSMLDKSCELLEIPSEYCFSNFFFDCRNITTPPELPALYLTRSCYNNIFAYCSSLTVPPELPAAELEDYCYDGMFSGCTSLHVSDTPSEGYSREWKIPTDGIASGNYTMYDMFSNCPGNRSTDDPNFNGIQKTYYIQNTPV